MVLNILNIMNKIDIDVHNIKMFNENCGSGLNEDEDKVFFKIVKYQGLDCCTGYVYPEKEEEVL